MREKNIDGVIFLEFDIYQNINWFRHAYSTKVGGVSTGVFAEMNLGFRGDREENVRENYRLFCNAAGFTLTGVTFSAQTHGTNIRPLTRSDKGKGFHSPKEYDNIDGIITNEKGIVMTTFYADCTPVFLADVENKAIGLLHAGWRGTVNNIVENALLSMKAAYGTKPENIVGAIGPAICYDCFEVDLPVYGEFLEKLKFSPKYMKPQPGVPDKYLIDLKNINKELLIRHGVPENNIEVSRYCTKCCDKLFFSHRRSGQSRGSMAAMMEII